MQNDHYKTLGVIDTAEGAVIKAAYKALMQIYHPDRFENDQKRAEATKKAQEINEAYRVLSNPKLRKEYDAQRDSYQNEYVPENNSSAEEQQKNDVLEENWNIANQFVPKLNIIYKSLTALSPELGFTFKLSLLENKRFSEAEKFAKELEHSYLVKYFGVNTEIHSFTKWLLQNKRRDVALEVNKIVNVLGNNFDAGPIISKIISKHELQYIAELLKNDNRYYVCQHCGFEGRAKLKLRGNFLTFLLLSVLFVLPGILYVIYTLASDDRAVCPECGKVINKHHKN
jgi:curved DNA-binding protein CbpA/predicted RNA-binding Zn-ribbon protein involved in translation (DUF1610 family)